MGRRYQTILAGTNDEEKLVPFWQKYYTELPLCKERGCDRIAMEVDTFYPYLDDLNRCTHHLSLDKAKEMARSGGCTRAINAAARRQVILPSHWRGQAR